MKISGLNVDVDAIGAGMFRIIEDKGEASIVAFGMIPVWVMDALRPMLCQKIVSESAKQRGITARELRLMGLVDEAKVGEIAREIEKAVVSAIYKAANQQGKMVV